MTSKSATAVWFLMIVSMALSLTSCHSLRTKQDPVQKGHEMAASDNVRLGTAYLQQGLITRAKHKFNVAIEQAPNWPPALNGMAYFLTQTAEYSEAEHYYRRSLAIAPQLGDTHNNYGTFLYNQKKYEQAINEFVLATRDPKFMLSGAAFENAGLSALKLPDKERALQFFQKAVLQDTQRPTSYIELVKLMYEKGDIPQASRYLDAYENVAGMNKESMQLAYLLAKSHHRPAKPVAQASNSTSLPPPISPHQERLSS